MQSNVFEYIKLRTKFTCPVCTASLEKIQDFRGHLILNHIRSELRTVCNDFGLPCSMRLSDQKLVFQITEIVQRHSN